MKIFRIARVCTISPSSRCIASAVLGILCGSIPALASPAPAGLPLQSAEIPVQARLESAWPGYRFPSGEIKLVAQAVDLGDKVERHSTLVSVSAGVELPMTTLLLRSKAVWEISLEAEGLWAEKAVFFLEPAGQTIRLRVRPTAIIAATLRLPEKEKAPPSVHVRFAEAPKPLSFGQLASQRNPPDFQGENRCLLEKTEIRCTVPAGRSDFSIHAAGFVAHYFWDVEMKPGITRVLPPLRMQPGASVSGWVEVAEGEGKIEQVMVELGPRMAASDLDLGSQIRSQQQLKTLHPNARGFYHSDGIPAGGYSVTGRLAGYADAGPLHFEVVRGLETRIGDPLSLRLPEDLVVILEPPLSPKGGPWKLRFAELGRIPGTFGKIHPSNASADGWARLEDLRPGQYLLFIDDQDGQQWHSQEIEVTDDPAPLTVSLDLEAVRGEVTLGGEPLAASLWFGGRFGATRVRFESAADGSFAGSLPRKETWRVDVVAEEPPVSRAIPSVEVHRVSGESTAFVEIALPATRVWGRVIDEQGEPLRRAFVRALSLARTTRPAYSSVLVDERDKGRFELRGFPAEPLLLSADAEEGRQSDQVTVDVTEGGSGQEVNLVVRQSRRLQGRVVAYGSSPVPGVAAHVTPLGGPVTFTSTEASRYDGTFPIAVPPSTREAMITLFPPGFAMRNVIVALGEESSKEIELRVHQQGGTLELVLPQLSESEGAKVGVVLFNGSGASLSPQMLAHWAAMNGEPAQGLEQLRVPNVEEGSYSLCLVSAAEQVSARPREVARQRCASGYLAPLGYLELSLADGQ